MSQRKRIYNTETKYRRRRTADGVNRSQYKPVLKYSLSGTYMDEFENVKAAAASLGKKRATFIGKCASGIVKHAYGHIWKFKIGNENPIIVSKAGKYEVQGKRFGKLVAVEKIGVDDFGNAVWSCKCDCGNIKIAKAYRLNGGKTWHCGCVGIIEGKKLKNNIL